MSKESPIGAEILTQREKEIITLISQGFTHKEVANKLAISHKTVSCHRANIKRKLQVKSLAQLVRWAIRLDLISVS